MFFRTKKVKGYSYLQIVESYREVVKRFQNCFGIRDVCIVADRGMISDEMLKFLGDPECSFSYILGLKTCFAP
ncbi:MAG: hypothetical protein QXH80_01605 [Candidatus Nanoarchaeia archaeon]